MDKRVIFAVAGSGKTMFLTEHLTENSRALLLTHTRNNEANLRAKLIQRFGFIPGGIRVMTWFEFLHGFCCRPLLQQHLQSRGLSFARPVPGTARTQHLHFQDSSGRLYHRRLSLLLMYRNMMPDICARLAQYCDVVLVDEVQDFAGHDFNFLLGLCSAEISVLLAGDFYQHTFDTSWTAIPTQPCTMISPVMKAVFWRQELYPTGSLSAKPGAARHQCAVSSLSVSA